MTFGMNHELAPGMGRLRLKLFRCPKGWDAVARPVRERPSRKPVDAPEIVPQPLVQQLVGGQSPEDIQDPF